MFTARLKMLHGCTDLLHRIFICVPVREWPIRPKQWCHLPGSHPHSVALCARLLLFFQRGWVLWCRRVLPEQYLPQTLHGVSILPPPLLRYQHKSNSTGSKKSLVPSLLINFPSVAAHLISASWCISTLSISSSVPRGLRPPHPSIMKKPLWSGQTPQSLSTRPCPTALMQVKK